MERFHSDLLLFINIINAKLMQSMSFATHAVTVNFFHKEK